MPASQLNGNSAEEVRAYLRQVPNSTLSELRVGEADRVAIFKKDRVVAAFAFAGSDPFTTYRDTYEAFKNESERLPEWDRFDLSFVLCVSEETDKLDELASDIETDVYFCRKFVVPLLSPVGNSLARLPFLPLARLDGPSLRPSSAQTFLQQCGVPTALARQITVQHERGAERIIDSCLEGEFGKPGKLTRAQTVMEAHAEPVASPVLLEALTIENFRAYKHPQSFEIGSEITVLYGPNGFGKTSFFDAVDFAVTGSIGRLKFSSTDHFREVAAHLDSEPEDARVTLAFRAGGETHTIDRTVADASYATMNGAKLDRKSILKTLTASGDSVAERIDNLINLFRATHLFSQDNQALTKSFKDHCSLPREIVSRMLAFEDYENAVKKASAVADLLEKKIDELTTELEADAASLKEDKTEFESLRRTTIDKTNSGALNTEIRNLRKELVDVGVNADSGVADATVVRGWRATLEMRAAESESRTARLSLLAKEITNLPPITDEAKQLKVRLDAGEARRKGAEQAQQLSRTQLQASLKKIADNAAQIRQVQAALDNLKWIRSQRPTYRKLLDAATRQAALVSQAAEAMVALRGQETAAKDDLNQKSSLLQQANNALSAAKKRQTDFEEVRSVMPSWKAGSDRLAEIKLNEATLNESLIGLRGSEPTLQAQIDAQAAHQSTLTRIIADADRSRTEMQQLLSQLQKHITDGHCPLCGIDHGSQEELVSRIHSQIALDGAGTARTELASSRQLGEEIARQLGINREAQRSAQAQLRRLSEERTLRELEAANWAAKARTVGLDLSSGWDGLRLQADLLPKLSPIIRRVCSGYAPPWGVLRTQLV